MIRKAAEQAYSKMVSAADGAQSVFLLAVRIYWGWQMAQTGWGKLHDLGKVSDFFTQLGIPAPGLTAVLISILEFVGGISVAVGFASRLVAALLMCDMAVAFLAADRDALFSIFSDPDKLYASAPYPFLLAFLIVLVFGAGRYCVDGILAKRHRSPMTLAGSEAR